MNTTSETLQQAGRSATSMTLTTLALTIATAIGAEHLSTLRQQPPSISSYHLLATLLFPTFPLVDLILSITGTFRNHQRSAAYARPSWHYLACRALDLRAVPEVMSSKLPRPHH